MTGFAVTIPVMVRGGVTSIPGYQDQQPWRPSLADDHEPGQFPNVVPLNVCRNTADDQWSALDKTVAATHAETAS